MKGTFAVAALAAGVSAGSVHHRHNHAHDLVKKGYSTAPAPEECGATTVYSTYYGSPTLVFPPPSSSSTTSSSTSTYVAPTTSSVAPTTTSSTVPESSPYSVVEYPTTSVAVPETTKYPVTSVYVPETTYPVATTSTSEASYPTSSSHSSPPGGSGGHGGAPGPGAPGKPWAVTYTPYETDAAGGCKSQDQINSDIAAIAAAGVDTIRVYSTDCSTLPWVGGACAAHGVKMILGIYVDAPGCSADTPSISEQTAAIEAWGQWSLVDAIIVGNEATENGFCTPSQLAGLISSTKSQLSYTGPYSTAETVNIWELEEFTSAVCPVVSFVGANAHAFFNTQTTASQAGQFVQSQLDIIEKACSGKEGRIMETGWPVAGNTMGLAVPGEAEQAEAIKSIIELLGDKCVIFSLTSDLWKSDFTACACESHWGCASVLGINI